MGKPSDADEKHERFMARLEAFTIGEDRRCIHCDMLVTAVEKIGRSSYARPCGCRLWQGDVPDWARR